jgi:hypothetical protein
MAEEPSEHEKAAAEMREFEQSDEVPSDLSEWPTGKAKYVTFGEDSDDAYGEGPTSKLGPAEVAWKDDGSVTVGGEEANREDYKGEPISGGMVEQLEESKRKYREIMQDNPEFQQDDGDGDAEK